MGMDIAPLRWADISNHLIHHRTHNSTYDPIRKSFLKIGIFPIIIFGAQKTQKVVSFAILPPKSFPYKDFGVPDRLEPSPGEGDLGRSLERVSRGPRSGGFPGVAKSAPERGGVEFCLYRPLFNSETVS